MKRSRISLTLTVLLLAAGLTASGAENPKGGRQPVVQKTTGTPVVTWMNINNISTVLRNNGTADIDISQTNSGLVFPKGSSKTAMFESGLLWAAMIAGDPQVRVGGSAYTSGLQPGKMLGPSQSEDPNLPKNRIYRVRMNYRKADLTSEMRDEGRSAEAIRAQYDLDWKEWPVADGAPYFDADSNGAYDPAIDIPGVPGADMTIWFVANDNNPTNVANLYGANPLGVECQVTTWAYAQEGALGNMIFKSYLLINKSTTVFDSMYVCQWADPDLGNATDDFAGCDTSLSLGYIYNALNADATYNPLPPPAAGFDFFQGPRVPSPGDSTIFRGKTVYGYRSLPMTAFFYFINSDPTLADPTRGDPAGSTQFYNFMRGRIGLTGEFFQDPQGNPTTFTLTGDPRTGRGWIDGEQFPAGDRRIGLSSGPFTMAPGDSQEIVVAEICAGAMPGVDRLSAVELLKFYDKSAQLAYDNFFNLPSPPPAPRVIATELNNEVVLEWGSDEEAVAATEHSDIRGFQFQGYNVYQLPSASSRKEEGKKIAVYDIPDGVTRIATDVFEAEGGLTSKVVQHGTDSGLKRYLSVKGDALNGGAPLINGIRYYFAVTAYSYNSDPNAVPNNLENPITIVTVVPHSTNPGNRLPASSGDTVQNVVQTVTGGAPSDGSVIPLVVDPTRLKGHTYRVTFATDTLGATTWQLTDVTENAVVLTGQTNQSGDDVYPIIDGVLVKVLGPPPGMKGWGIQGTRRLSWAGGAGFGLEHFYSTDSSGAADRDNGSVGNAFDSWFSSSSVGYAGLRTVLLRLAATDGTWDPHATPADPNFSRGYRYLRRAAAAAEKPEFTPWMVNPSAGYAYQDYNYSVPFSAWDMDSNPPRRLAVGHLENNVADGLVDGKYWPPPSNSDDAGFNVGPTGPREWFFIFDVPYSEQPDVTLQADILNTTLPIMWMGTPCRRGDATFTAGDGFLIKANHVNSPAHTFTYTTSKPTVGDAALAKTDVEKINVFPNPYYGVNTEELNKYQRFVTFSHLPRRASIKIFNLAGVQVRQIQKNSESQFERWDLANDSGLPVGSGLYIVHITMPDLGGKSKILKLAVVQEQQILDRF